jgi:hypothetical protein
VGATGGEAAETATAPRRGRLRRLGHDDEALEPESSHGNGAPPALGIGDGNGTHEGSGGPAAGDGPVAGPVDAERAALEAARERRRQRRAGRRPHGR